MCAAQVGEFDRFRLRVGFGVVQIRGQGRGEGGQAQAGSARGMRGCVPEQLGSWGDGLASEG